MINVFGLIMLQIRWAAGISADGLSFLTLSSDFVLYRLLRIAPWMRRDRLRTIRLRDGTFLTYRLNRGDIWAIYEVWMKECYAPPEGIRNDVLIDLGANVGFASLWFAKKLGFKRVVSVEASPSNATVLRDNYKSNNLMPGVVEAAVGATVGEARFNEYNWSTYNGLCFDRGEPPRCAGLSLLRQYSVSLRDMPSILGEFVPDERISLVKIDIEGGEQELLTGDAEWLLRVDACVAEFHPPHANIPQLVRIFEEAGLGYLPPSERSELHWFIRRGSADV